MKKVLNYIGFPLMAVLILIQFIPFGISHDNPQVVSEPKWNSETTKQLFNRACADCHSNNTNWPWYSNVAPLSWIISNHVEEGREHFNVSMWGVQKKNEGEDAAEEVEEGEMPLFGYDITHPEAILSDEEKILLINGLKSTFGEEDEHH